MMFETRKSTLPNRATTAANNSSVFGTIVNVKQEDPMKKKPSIRMNSSFGISYRGNTTQNLKQNQDLMKKQNIENVIANRSLNLFTE